MGKTVGGLPEAAPLAVEADAEEAFALGSWLTRQRELRGISREELSALTRLPMRSLERLETGAFDGQQDGFVRGFVRTVAVAIGLDPDDAVARLLAEPAARPRQRRPDPRRLAVAAVGIAGLFALAAALIEWAQAPPDAAGAAEYAPILRPDPVRALAIEQGLLSADEPAEGLRLEAAVPPPPEGEEGGAAADPTGARPPASP